QPAEGHASHPRRLRARPPAPRPPDGTARQFAAGPAAHSARLAYGQAASRGQPKAMIHIMGDLRETTAEMQRRERELRDKQEQLVQAGKLATLGELTTGVA